MRLSEDKDKSERIQIRCTEETLVRFQEFAAGYTTQAQAIRDALDTFDEYPSLFTRSKGK